MTKKHITALALAACLLFAAGCRQDGPPQTGYRFLNENTNLSLNCGDTKAAEKEILSFLADFEAALSVNIEGSEIYRLNNAAAGEKVELSKHTRTVLARALEIYDLSGGAFSPFTYGLSKLWGFADGYTYPSILPQQDAIAELLPFVFPEKAADNIVIGQDGYAYKKFAGVQLDLGAIAKGYAAEMCADIATRHGVSYGIINIAGNLYLLGRKPGDEDFKIGITDPRGAQHDNDLFAKTLVSDISVSVSGDYQRYFRLDGKRYCHIIDPSTGYPVESGVISVIIFDKNGMDADAFGTAAMVMGAENGIKFLNDNGKSGIIITEKHYYIAGDIQIEEVYGEYSQKKL